MKLFLVRHAEGENYKNNWQSPNTPLSDFGVKQVKALAATQRFKEVSKIFSSDFARAKQTADIIASSLGQTVEERLDLRERSQSSRITGLVRIDPLSQKYITDLQETTYDWDYKWDSEEESKNEVRVRAINFKNYIEQTFSDESVLAVTHENFLKHLIPVCLLGANDVTKDMDKLYRSINIENTGVSLLIFNPDSKMWKIWYINDYSHLGSVKP